MAKSTPDNPAEHKAEDAPVTIEEAIPRLATSDKIPAFVQYVGTAHVREIAALDWRNVGVEDQVKVVWDKRKFRGDRVAVSDLTPAAVEYCIQFDGGFRLLDEDGKVV